MRRSALLLAACAVLALAVTALAAPRVSPPPPAPPPPPRYLALGDSLAAGVQPAPDGSLVRTDEGYPDRLAALTGAELTNLGCPGETVVTMVEGGICPYPSGSQLDQALHELRASRRPVALVTIDIGANDVQPCVRRSGTGGGPGRIDRRCVLAGFADVDERLPGILAALRKAAGPDVPIVGMTYYNPTLAAWLDGPDGRDLARDSAAVADAFNDLLADRYAGAGALVADVDDAFASAAFSPERRLPGVGLVPLNVARVCEWTWMCAPPPRGPDIHANAEGYARIAAAFATALADSGQLPRATTTGHRSTRNPPFVGDAAAFPRRCGKAARTARSAAPPRLAVPGFPRPRGKLALRTRPVAAAQSPHRTSSEAVVRVTLG